MKAVVATRYGSPEVLQLVELPKPVPADHEIRIKVHATTVNVGDSRMRSFTVPPIFWLPARLTVGLTKPKNPVFGFELAGEVDAIGKSVTRFKVGDEVFGSAFGVNFGAHAEYKCLPEDGIVALKPANLTYAEAAAVPLGANTALQFLKEANIQRGQKVLVIGASGSVGTYAVQLARHFGAEVTGVCSTTNVHMVKSLGAQHVIDYTQEDFTRNGQTYDIIYDAVGKSSFGACAASLNPNGTYISTVAPTAALQAIWAKWTVGKHVVGGNALESPENLALIKELLEQGKLKPVIDACYPLAEIADAHRHVDTGHKKGNVVVLMTDN